MLCSEKESQKGRFLEGWEIVGVGVTGRSKPDGWEVVVGDPDSWNWESELYIAIIDSELQERP